MNNNKNFYNEKFNIYSKEEQFLEKKFSHISTLRVFSFLLGLALLLIGIFDDRLIAGIFGALFLAAFLFFVRMHGEVVKKQEEIKSRLKTVGRYNDRFSEEWRNFSDTGKEFLEDDDTVSRDIDLLGKDSLFQLINVCHTEKGRRLFVENLKLNNFDLSKLKKKNDAVAELTDKKEFAIAFESAGIRLSENKHKQDIDKFLDYCDDDKTGILPAWVEVSKFILPLIEISLIVLSVIGVFNYGIPLAGFIAMLALAGFTSGITENTIVPFYSMGPAIEEYEDMLLLLENEKFESELIRELKEHISGECGAVNAFKALKKISQAYNISYNPFLHIIFTGLFLWDYHIAHYTARWKKRYGENLVKTFDVIAETENLLSLSVLGCIRETGWARIYEDNKKAGLEADEMFHPLINPEKVVENSIKLSGGATIITGSNMSGKTTFLRTAAVNLVLAYMGAPVCAKKFEANYMKIFTSMRVMDDVANGISTFYAEILRIKAMAKYKEKDVPMICLIDEIFKGTNSADRIVGAREAITRLAGEKCITLVSTHDFELCDLEDKDKNRADNYHFEEYYDNDELKFDYKIRSGKCTTTNALAILRLAGFEV